MYHHSLIIKSKRCTLNIMIIIMPPKEISKHYRTNNMLRKGMIMMRSDEMETTVVVPK